MWWQLKSFSSIWHDTPTGKIGEVTDGWWEIKGRIAPKRKKGRLITAPLTGKRCVYYEFTVTNHDGEHSSTLIHDEKKVAWYLADDTGTANIDLDGAELVLDTDLHEQSGMLNPASPKLKAILAKYKKSNKGWVFEKPLSYMENILEVDDELHIFGLAKVVKGNVCFKASSGQPLIVSDNCFPFRVVVKRIELKAIAYTLAAVFVLLAAIFVLIR